MDVALPAMTALLEHVSAVKTEHDRQKTRVLRSTAPDFRLFSFFKIDENTLSKCLAFLLDPKATHGQGDLFISSFYALNDLPCSPQQTQCVRTFTEYTLDSGRRLDILITDNVRLIGIENKPWAADQDRQLIDYAQWLAKETSGRRSQRDWSLIYLSNNDVSEASLPARTSESLRDKIIFLTFFELEAWLTDCAAHIQAPQVHSFVMAMAEFVREKLNGETSMALQNTLSDVVMASPENLTAALLISQNMTEVKARLWRSFIDDIAAQLRPEGIAVETEDALFTGKRWAGFYVVFDQQDKLALKWEFEYAHYVELVYGICARDMPTNSLRARLCKPVFEELTALFPDLSAANDKTGWWPWWSYADTLDIPRNWLATPEAWTLLLDRGPDSFAQKVINMALAIQQKGACSLFR